jgi:hypothetical protein
MVNNSTLFFLISRYNEPSPIEISSDYQEVFQLLDEAETEPPPSVVRNIMAFSQSYHALHTASCGSVEMMLN